MKKSKFSEIWVKIIEPYLKIKLSNNNQLYALHGTNKKSNGRNKVEFQYGLLNKKIKRDFMLQSSELIDRHKICSCLYIALVNSPLLKVRNGYSEIDRWINAELAFFVSLRVLLSFVLDDARSSVEYSSFLMEHQILCFPENKDDNSKDVYLTQTVKSLCHAQSDNKLSILMLANIFFLLESYTDYVFKYKFASKTLQRELVNKVKRASSNKTT